MTHTPKVDQSIFVRCGKDENIFNIFVPTLSSKFFISLGIKIVVHSFAEGVQNILEPGKKHDSRKDPGYKIFCFRMPSFGRDIFIKKNQKKKTTDLYLKKSTDQWSVKVFMTDRVSVFLFFSFSFSKAYCFFTLNTS